MSDKLTCQIKFDLLHLIKLEVPSTVDKAAIETAAIEKYQAQLHLLESQYRTQFQGITVEHQNEIITLQRQHSTELIEVVRSMANRPVIITNTNNNNVEANAVSNSQSSGDTYNGTAYGVFHILTLANRTCF